MTENPKYTLTICFNDDKTKDVFADKVLYYDNFISISRQEDCTMIVPYSGIKYLLAKRFKA